MSTRQTHLTVNQANSVGLITKTRVSCQCGAIHFVQGTRQFGCPRCGVLLTPSMAQEDGASLVDLSAKALKKLEKRTLRREAREQLAQEQLLRRQMGSQRPHNVRRAIMGKGPFARPVPQLAKVQETDPGSFLVTRRCGHQDHHSGLTVDEARELTRSDCFRCRPEEP